MACNISTIGHSDFDLSLRRIMETNDLDFTYSQYDLQNTEIDIDPENNFFARPINDCQYYAEDLYNSKFKNVNSFSVIHFNSQSLYANFDLIKSYLKHFFKTIQCDSNNRNMDA